MKKEKLEGLPYEERVATLKHLAYLLRKSVTQKKYEEHDMNMNQDSLFCVEDGSGEEHTFVLAPSLRGALIKYKDTIASYVNEDYAADGVDKVITADDVADPESISLVAFPEQVML